MRVDFLIDTQNFRLQAMQWLERGCGRRRFQHRQQLYNLGRYFQAVFLHSLIKLTICYSGAYRR